MLNTGTMTTPISLLELAGVGEGYTPADALAQATTVAQHAESLGFARFWVAEHHAMAAVASSAPAVLLAHVASATKTIRLGAGGVMLPNHAPMVIAEQFGTLEALHPGRIDLGLGRAPGSDPKTARALRRTAALSSNRFPEDVVELFGYFQGDPTQPAAMPAAGYLPEIWLLGSSLYSAQLAAMLGIPFAFAYHFAPALCEQALELYRNGFRPSHMWTRPKSMAVVTALAADSDEEAHYLAQPAALSMMLLRTNRMGPLPTPEYAAAYPYSDAERQMVEELQSTYVIGGPTQVRKGLESFVARFGVDELMITMRFHSLSDRLNSLSVIAKAWKGALSEKNA